MEIKREELISLFLLLSRNETFLDVQLQALKIRIEKELYTFMSIAELEEILSKNGKPFQG